MSQFLEDLGSLIPELLKKEETLLILFILGLGGFASFSFFQFSLGPADIFGVIWRFIAATWWFWLFFPLIKLFNELLLFWRQEEYKAELNFVVLEIKIPREIQKSPKSMEQIFQIIHSLRNAATNVKAEYFEGETTSTFAFEMASIGGESHFYVRCVKKYANIIEGAFFSYYPDVELFEAPDYTTRLPQTPEEMYRAGMKLWGIELVLSKDSMFPIKTYPNFELGGEEGRMDPLSAFLEVFGKMKPQEFFGVQILASPVSSSWADDYKEDLEEFREKTAGTKTSGGGEEGLSPVMTFTPQPQRMEVLKAIESNISKPAFEVVIRLMYMAPEDIFTDKYIRRAIITAFNQYSAMNLNGFRQNFGMGTRTEIWYSPYIYPERRGGVRRQRLLYNYLKREMPQETWIAKFITSHIYNWNFHSESFYLNVEGLATIFHLPAATVLTSPHFQRIESRKASPSAGLPIFGADEDIEKFY